jgi:hypothetical protein
VGCDLVSPFRVFGFAAGLTAFRPLIILLGLAARSATSSATVSHHWFSDPTVPLAVASAVWFFRSRRSWLRLSKPTCIRSRVYLPQSIRPANPSRRAAAHQLLSWAFIPYSTLRDGRSTFRGLCLARCVPSSGFGYPRDGLRPSRPWPVLFRTGSAHGIHPSELPPLKSYLPVSEQNNPPTVSPACIPFAEASGRLAGRSSWVFNLFKIPGGSHVFSTSTAGCSLGFLPSRALHENLGWDFAQPPLTRFPSSRSRTAVPQSFDRSSLQPHPPFT